MPPIQLWNGLQAKRDEIPEYFNEYYTSALLIYNRFKRFGLPFSGGWMEQPAYIMKVLELFEVISNSHEKYITDKQNKKMSQWQSRRKH